MIDMSLGKLALLAIMILVVWYGFKYAARVGTIRRNLEAERARRRGGDRPARPVEDLVKCGKCGAFVAATGAANCGKPGCPWGR